MHRLGLFRGKHSYGCLQLTEGACSKEGLSSLHEIVGFCLCPMCKGFFSEWNATYCLLWDGGSFHTEEYWLLK